MAAKHCLEQGRTRPRAAYEKETACAETIYHLMLARARMEARHTRDNKEDATTSLAICAGLLMNLQHLRL